MDEDRCREVGLFRYALIRGAADQGLSRAERGRMVRALAEREHLGPDGRPLRVGRTTLDWTSPALADTSVVAVFCKYIM